jgi:hypothetical protein
MRSMEGRSLDGLRGLADFSTKELFLTLKAGTVPAHGKEKPSASRKVRVSSLDSPKKNPRQ